jgi:alpha-D-ribose 1-methylphosphonate 5-triphosphate diphosphatase
VTILTNAQIVLRDGVLNRGTLVFSDGHITAVEDGTPPDVGDAVDLDGAYVLPGLIDLHNDALEGEVNPRPEAALPLNLAFAHLERRLIASGVTTEFHAIAFMDDRATDRSATMASERSAFIAAQVRSGAAAIDHQVLHRIDVWHPEALDLAFTSVAQHRTRYISLNDHTPGQGQYRDPSKLAQQVQRLHGRGMAFGYDLDDDLTQLVVRRRADSTTVSGVYARIRDEFTKTRLHVASHDDDTVDKVDTLFDLGASISEFPVTLEAAARAYELGMSIVVGAPNVVRGGSQSGNLAAREVVERGWEPIMCADYHAPSLLPAVFRLVDEGSVDLAAGVRMTTLNAARAVALEDRGEIRVGLRADLVVVRRDAAGLPLAERVYSAGRPIYRFATTAARMLSGSRQ